MHEELIRYDLRGRGCSGLLLESLKKFLGGLFITGHHVYADQPDEFNSIIIKILEQR
jgi:hypothetical protein